MKPVKPVSVTLKNPRTGELWICEDVTKKRSIDGVDFIQVHGPDNNRLVWIAQSALTRINKQDRKF